MKKNDSNTTHFGFQDVPTEQKASKVAEVFHSVAKKYDVMNDVMSFGLHRIWKRFAINLCALRKGQKVLDLAGGTGDLTARISPVIGPEGKVITTDINDGMLKVGRDRLLDKGLFENIDFVQADAEQLPFPSNYFDCIIIGFGLRNVTRKENALASMFRCLKPGGRLIILEFSKAKAPLLSPIYDLYSFKLLPLFGKLIAKDEESYRYLAESIRMHPDQSTLKAMMKTAEFERCDYHNLSGGIVAVHRGFKC
jgi:demethylmenaquinone methyltransferase/2-methoxy-6-polyprenyl-1,4-benzoquinol methylase